MGDITGVGLVIYAVTVFLSAILSGIAGGGGGFINTPMLIFLGLSPAQAISTGKLSGLAVSIASLTGLRGVKVHSKKTVVIIMLIALLAGMIAPFVIVGLESSTYRTILGTILILMVPVLYVRKSGKVKKKVSSNRKLGGYGIISASLLLQGIFSGGIGTFVNVALIEMLGLSALEASVVKRFSQVVLNVVIVVGVFYSGLILWHVAIIGIIFSGLGGFIGSKFAAKNGDGFVMKILLFLMLASGLYLIFGE